MLFHSSPLGIDSMISYTFYTDNIPEGFGGVSYGPYIKIRPKYREDSGIHAHEQTHANQWWAWFLAGAVAAYFLHPLGNFYWYYALLAGVGMHGLLYKFVQAYRLWCEVRAYRVQLGHYATDKRLQFAGFISHSYRLDISTEDAFLLLKD